MSDVVVSVTESTTSVTVTEQDVTVAVTETPVTVTTASVGLQGIPGTNGTNGTNGSAATITAGSATVLASTATPTVTNTGTSSAAIFNFGIPAGSAGSAGVSGVISVTSPITNTGSASSAILGIDQTLLSITKSQVSDFTSGTVTSATTAGTAVYATTSGTSVSISGSITKSQVSDFTSGTVAIAGTASYATTSGTSVYATNSGTSVYATTSGTSVFSTTSGTSVYATNAGTAVNISGTVTQSQVTSLTSDLTARAVLASGNSFTGIQTFNATPSIGTDTPITAVGGTGQSVPLQSWKNVSLTSLASVDSNGYGNFARVSAGQNSDLGYAMVSVLASSAATKGVVVRAVASQSANILEIQSSAASPQVYINSSYEFVTPTNVYANAILNNGGFWSFNNNGVGNIAARNATNIPLTLKGAASQTADAMQYQSSAAVVLGGRNAVGQAYTGSTTTIKSAVGGTIQSIATGANPLVTVASTHNLAVGDLVTLASTTSGTYDGTFVVATTPAATTFTITTSLTTGQASAAGTVSVPAQKSITSRSAATIGAVIRGAASQASDLLQLTNNGGTILAKIDASGVVTANSMLSINGYLAVGENTGGGTIKMQRATGTPTSPGTNQGRLYFKAGTTGLALYVMGPTGTEIRLADNIT